MGHGESVVLMPSYSQLTYIPDEPPTDAEVEAMGPRAIRYVGRHPGTTASEIASALAVKLSSLSSALVKLVNAGKLHREPGVGPNGGNGYFPVPRVVDPITRIERALLRKTAWDFIDGPTRRESPHE